MLFRDFFVILHSYSKFNKQSNRYGNRTKRPHEAFGGLLEVVQ